MASVLRLELDQAAIRGLVQTGQPVHRWLAVTLANVDARAKMYLSGQMVNVRTGNLRSSQQSHIEIRGTAAVGVLENVASYARAVHDGTKPHDIRARNGKVLTGWVWRGQPVFTPVVHHPGTSARPWLLRAMTDVIRDQAGGLSFSTAI